MSGQQSTRKSEARQRWDGHDARIIAPSQVADEFDKNPV
jgi:hypothetical protein